MTEKAKERAKQKTIVSQWIRQAKIRQCFKQIQQTIKKVKEQEQKNIEFGKFIGRKRLLKRRVMLFNMYCRGATFDIRRQREIMHALVAVGGSV